MAAAGMPGGHSTVVTLIPVDNPTSGAAPSVPHGRSTVVTLTRADTRRLEHANGLGTAQNAEPTRIGSDRLWNVAREAGVGASQVCRVESACSPGHDSALARAGVR
jgi:hypothetical protein